MSEPPKLGVIQGAKKEPCVYCGEDAHKVPLACPRIAFIHVDTETGCVDGIEFREPLDVPTPPAAA